MYACIIGAAVYTVAVDVAESCEHFFQLEEARERRDDLNPGSRRRLEANISESTHEREHIRCRLEDIGDRVDDVWHGHEKLDGIESATNAENIIERVLQPRANRLFTEHRRAERLEGPLETDAFLGHTKAHFARMSLGLEDSERGECACIDMHASTREERQDVSNLHSASSALASIVIGTRAALVSLLALCFRRRDTTSDEIGD